MTMSDLQNRNTLWVLLKNTDLASLFGVNVFDCSTVPALLAQHFHPHGWACIPPNTKKTEHGMGTNFEISAQMGRARYEV